MKLFKKILGLIIGTALLGFGVALSKLSKLGQDPLSAFISTFQYLFGGNYGLWYTLINSVFFILMLIFLRKKIHIGTVINVLFTGMFSDLFLNLFNLINFNPTIFILRLIVTILGIIITCLGIAIHGSANLGMSAYEAVCVIIDKKTKKLSFKYIRIITDVTATLFALIVGVLILKKFDLVNINTILNFIFAGPLISMFSKIVVKYYYKEESSDFI